MVVWMENLMHGWVNVCVDYLLVVDLLGLWRGAKPVSLWAGALWRGLISRKPKLLLTTNQHTHSPIHASNHPFIQPSVRTLIHTSIQPPIHSPTLSFIHPSVSG